MEAPFKIDPQTGRIRLPELKLELWPRMPQQEFLTATSSLNRDNLGANGGWQRYSIHAQLLNDRKIGLFFVFFNDELNVVSFAYCHKDDTWENWSEERERKTAEDYKQQLALQLGPGNSFPWGRIGAEYDQRSGGTDIWLRYSED